MSEKMMEKIIGNSYVIHNDVFFVADIYEGNYYKILEGGVIKTMALPKKEYDRVVTQYEERVKKNEMIITAYELNKKAGMLDRVTDVTADPEAAEKEWYIRTHPQVVVSTEPKKKKLFGRRKKKAIQIKCLECGALHPEGQKFCSECGKALLSVEEEVKEENLDKALEKKAEDTPKSEALEVDEDFEIIDIELDEKIKNPEIEDINPKGIDEQVVSATDLPEKEPVKGKKTGKKRRWLLFIILLLLAIAGIGCFIYFYFGFGKELIFDSNNWEESSTVDETVTEEATETATSYVVIRTKTNIAQNTQIKEEHLEGTILSPEQYKKYNELSTYIDKDGKSKSETLLLWEDKDTVIGKYATKELTPGSILYDTSITSEHVVADKTYVDVEIDGEKKTYETKTDVLPGNTKIQIVALIQTDGAEATSVLLSELTLQDRSLESIFDSAGQDILELLSDTSEENEAEEEAVESEAEEVSVEESAGEQDE